MVQSADIADKTESLIGKRARYVGGGYGRRSRRVPINAYGQEAQHFLLSAASVDVDEDDVARMTEDEAHEAYEAIRFAKHGGVPYCPYCATENAYKLTITRKTSAAVYTARIYKCRACRKKFSLTSGTIFANRKMTIRDTLSCLLKFANGASGQAALQLRRRKSRSYKTSFVFEGKCREALALSRDQRLLIGNVEVDGSVVGGRGRPANEKSKGRVVVAPARTPGRAVVALRERRPNGVSRVIIVGHESHYRDGTANFDFIRDNVDPDATLISDEGFELGYIAEHHKVKHKDGFKIGDIHTNGVESLFARLKRADRGVYHHINGPYLDLYAEEVSWREDYRRKSNGEQWEMLISAVTSAPVSRRWSGYWQRWQHPELQPRRRKRSALPTRRTNNAPSKRARADGANSAYLFLTAKKRDQSRFDNAVA